MAVDSHKHFDYVIVGSGLAGLQLALEFSKDPYFSTKRIALIDSKLKNENDKTWCFWEKGPGKWESIVSYYWNTGIFRSPNLEIDLTLSPYQYKMIRSIDFYNYCIESLELKPNIKFFTDSVIKIVEREDLLTVICDRETITCNYAFDSRLPKEFFEDKKANKIQQHFKGYLIKTEVPVFHPDKFVMMDYRLRDQQQTSFTYVLPYSKTSALVEYTYFTENTVEESIYDRYLKEYISEYLKIDKYAITEIEKGNIPMTDFAFDKFNTNRLTKIGTAGGWVKGSTGYSFKNTERKISILCENLKSGVKPSKNLFKPRFQFYDSIFLNVLKNNNKQGMFIFEKFYSRNKTESILAFLDETSNFKQELKILNSLFSRYFIASFLNYFLSYKNKKSS